MSVDSTAPGTGTSALIFAVGRGRLGTDPKLAAKVESISLKYRSRLAEQATEDSLPGEVANLVSCYMAIASVDGNEGATYERFYSLMTAMVREWPQGATMLDNFYWSWPNRWPIRRQTGFWRFALTRRATS